MKWSTDEGQRLLAGLAGVERAVVAFYRVLLALIIVAILAAAVFVVVRRPWGAGHQGEWFYFSVAVLLALGWAVAQFIQLGRRQRKNPSRATFHSRTSGGARVWEFRFGSRSGLTNPEADAARGSVELSFSRGLNVPLASLSRDVLPDDSALDCIEAELARGVELDDACRLIQPAYGSWNSLQQKACRMYVMARLEERRRPDESDTVPPFEG